MSYDTKVKTSDVTVTDANPDLITGAPGSHPIGTGIGAAVGGAAAGVGAAAVGAAVGTVVGPVGTVVGAAVGAIVGGLVGKGVGEAIDPTSEVTYWRNNFKTRPYATGKATFEEYEPAYAYGVSSYAKYPGRSFDQVETDLSRNWLSTRGKSNLDWDSARPASRDAWERNANR